MKQIISLAFSRFTPFIIHPQTSQHMTQIIKNYQHDQYTRAKLGDKQVASDPLAQFTAWFQEAKDAQVPMPEVVNLATAELPSGRVSNRMVLFKETDENGNFIVYSNWVTSRKGKDVASNPHVSITFFWRELERQVRVEGKTQRCDDKTSETYFHTRPRASQLGAWGSRQSEPVESREALESEIEKVASRYGQDEIPCPPFWGGMQIVPDRVEFWQGRENRVHDRLSYSRQGDAWRLERLCP